MLQRTLPWQCSDIVIPPISFGYGTVYARPPNPVQKKDGASAPSFLFIGPLFFFVARATLVTVGSAEQESDSVRHIKLCLLQPKGKIFRFTEVVLFSVLDNTAVFLASVYYLFTMHKF